MRRVTICALVLIACGRTAIYGPRDGTSVPSTDAGIITDAGAPGPCIVSRVPTVAWQIHAGVNRVQCFGMTFPTNGDPAEYAFASIPPVDDPKWLPLPIATIDFAEVSRLCNADGGAPLCGCREGGDFTYFQTLFTLDAPARRFDFSVASVDDGLRVTLFNSKHPTGFEAGLLTLFGNRRTSDFAAETVAGENRLVLTHVDDCCRERRLDNALLTLDGEVLELCP